MRITLLLPLVIAAAAVGVGLAIAGRGHHHSTHPIAQQAQFERIYSRIISYHARIAKVSQSSTYHPPPTQLAPQPSGLTPAQKLQQQCLADVDRYNRRAAAIASKRWRDAGLPPQHLDSDSLCV